MSLMIGSNCLMIGSIQRSLIEIQRPLPD
eukprot:SAG11_NODE_8781_length_977_cov_1.394077_1_plen_28_part_10